MADSERDWDDPDSLEGGDDELTYETPNIASFVAVTSVAIASVYGYHGDIEVALFALSIAAFIAIAAIIASVRFEAVVR